MIKRQNLSKGIPIATSLQPTLEAENMGNGRMAGNNRIVTITLLSIGIAILISAVAKLLISLINLVTNLAFYGHFSAAASTPLHNHLGLWVIVIPAIGGIVIGFM